MYVIVALGAFGAQLNIGSEYFTVDSLGTKGCFTAMLTTFLACTGYTVLRKIRWMTLEEWIVGIGGNCVTSLQTLFPMGMIVAISALANQLIYVAFDVHGCYELVNEGLCNLFDFVATGNDFLTGLFYTFFVNFLWFFGLHGSNILEPVAQSNLAFSGTSIFSKPFYDVFVAMGGCGTTICVLIVLLLFFRGKRSGKIGCFAVPTVIFNLNEVLTFGLPIILNPIMFIPFLLTPVVCYCISYAATWYSLVPLMERPVTWTLPIGFGGYRSTGSVNAVILQFLCIVIGCMIYYPFLKLNEKLEKERAKETFKSVVEEMYRKEEILERSNLYLRSDHIGSTARMLLLDLKYAIRNRELYMLYQPQVGADGKCIGAEALIRWNHPVYGMVYPPLIIYLAEEGEILPELEKFLIESVTEAIVKIRDSCDEPFKVSINLTAHSLLWNVEDCIRDTLKQHEVDPKYLWIEITEQDILQQTDKITQKLKGFKEVGHTLLVDDFGMGHTSLLYLQSNVFDVVKLDGSLVKTILTNPTNQKIIGSIVELGTELGISVIAEYVETKEQQQMLQSLGCNCYQGYYYSKPIPLDEFIAYITNQNSQT
jgi:lactose/cellobiose-specific phosphotransferase system IIC component